MATIQKHLENINVKIAWQTERRTIRANWSCSGKEHPLEGISVEHVGHSWKEWSLGSLSKFHRKKFNFGKILFLGSYFYTAPISSCWQCRIAQQNVCCAVCHSNSEECNIESIGSHCLTISLLSFTINSHFSHENWQECEWIEGLESYDDVLNAIFASSLEQFCFVSCFSQFVTSSFPISLSYCSLQGDSFLRKVSTISEANCQAMKANTSLKKLTCPLILPASCVELFFNCIPSQLKEISTLVIFCASAGHCNTTIHSLHLDKTGDECRTCYEQECNRTTAPRSLSHNTCDAFTGGKWWAVFCFAWTECGCIQINCEESLQSFFCQNLPSIPLECLNLHVSIASLESLSEITSTY